MRGMHATRTTEQARLHAHFRDVLGELACRDMSHLDHARRASRGRLLDELARYARAGRFPRNRDFRDAQTPYFVDAAGTRCAMAHLIESTGGSAFVRRIATTANNARVRDLARDAELLAWLARAGLTLHEAARIQPSYCFITKADACFCDSVPVTGALEGMVVAIPAADMVTIEVVATHGDVGAIAAGQHVDTTGISAIGDPVIAGVIDGQLLFVGRSFTIHPDGTVALSCMLHVPALTKADAIDALLSTAPGEGGETACSISLAGVDPTWSDSQCEKSDHGCSVGGGAGLPVALVAAALWSRRPR
jgi:hypothetical protein